MFLHQVTLFSLMWVCCLAPRAPRSSILVAFTISVPQEDGTEENNNALSDRNINISRLETNCPRGLPGASEQKNVSNETRHLKKYLILDYMV